MNAIWSGIEPVLSALGWALLHSVWQVAALAAAYWSIRRTVPSASVRYRAGLALLALSLAWPAATAWRVWSDPLPSRAGVPGGLALHLEGRGAEELPVESPRGGEATPRAGVDALLQGAAACWLAAVGCLWLRIGVGAARAVRLGRRGALPAEPALAARVRDLAERMGITRGLRAVVSTRVDVPCVVGILRPTLLLPAATLTGIPAAQLEALLLHELAHVRRQDFLVNLLQTLAETLLFFHPAARWLSAEIRQEREHCCDDLVVAWTGLPAAYAEALAGMERRRTNVLAPAAASGDLRRRVARLVGGGAERDARALPAVILTGAGLCVLVAGVAVAGLGAASGQPEARFEQTAEHAPVVSLQALLIEIEPALLESLTADWQGRSSSGLRFGSAETGTLLRELRPPAARVFSAPDLMSRVGEVAKISAGGTDGAVTLEILPTEPKAGQLELDVTMSVAALPSKGDTADGARSRASALDGPGLLSESIRGWKVEPGRASILVAPWPLGAELTSEPSERIEHRPLFAVVLVAAVTSATSLDVATARKTFGTEWVGEPVSVSLRSSSLREVLQSFERAYGARVEWRGEGDEIPERPMTAELRDVPWDYALTHLLNAACFTVEHDGATWTASASAEAHQRLPGGSFVPCP